MNIDCNVIKDLIPLVNDDVASSQTKELVFEHCSKCSDCKSLLDEKITIFPKDEMMIKAIKKSLFISQIAIAILGILVGVWFTTSNNILYNFYIMPLVGAVSYLALKKKSLFVPLGIITTVELMQILKTIPFLSYNFGKAINQIGTLLISNIYFGIIYAILSLIGILIAFLFEFTFRRDKK
ncbi:MAG: hypothetical protein WC102_02800 [Saccharofermentanales bacterium]